MNMGYKLCILAAGKGTRNNSIKGIHKALLPLENKPVISHIINKLPKHIEIIIAVGYKSEQIKTYLNLVHSDRIITYVNIENYDGKESGPGLSLLLCEHKLQSPFIFTSVDTIVEESFISNKLTYNWIGISDINKIDSSKYCLIDGEKYLNKFYYGYGDKAFIGMAGIYDYKMFWDGLKEKTLIKNEHQVLNGFKKLKEIKLKYFKWYDTGNEQSYKETKNKFCNDIVASKSDEVLFIENNYVIKYFYDSNKINNRINRLKYLNGVSPKVKLLNNNMYYYNYVNGDTLSLINDINILNKIIPYWYENIGKYRYNKDENFLQNCKKMYYDKTYERCEYFVNNKIDDIKFVNGVNVDNIKNMLQKIDWELIYDNALPSNFHGDFQPENIIYNEDLCFRLIDWRDSFGDDLKIGDFYYDLGKMYHALLVNGKDVNNHLYNIKIENNNAYVFNHIRSNLFYLYDELKMFCEKNNFSWYNVKLLGTLQYISISSLYKDYHNGDYCNFLFLYGKYLLSNLLNI